MKLCQGLYTWTPALRTLFVYTEFTKKKVFGQLMLAVACSARRRPASREVSMSECDLIHYFVVSGKTILTFKLKKEPHVRKDTKIKSL